MSRELAKVADEIGREKGITREILTDALKEAIIAAVARKVGKYAEPDIDIDLEKGMIDILVPKEVVEEVDNRWYEIHIDNAPEFKENPQLGDVIMVPTTLEELGRQAALVAKQKLFEKLRDAEKQVILDEFSGKVGEIVNGTVLKTDRDNLIVNIGKTEAFLPKREKISGDFYGRGDYIRALLLEIRTVRGWPQLVLSRTHHEFLKKMFEVEIPEVYDGTIEVKAVAREPGDRAKVAVYTLSNNIDPVGACIGLKGSRINSISNEMRGEKIDVIQWSPDAVRFVCNAISPAQVVLTNVFEDENTLEIIVPDDQLSLAIGRKGQNVRLAAQITGWKLDVLKESEYSELRKQRMADHEAEMKEFYELYSLENLPTLNDDMIAALHDDGIDDIEMLSSTSVDEIVTTLSIAEDEAVMLINAAIDYLTSKLEEIEEEEAEGEMEEDAEINAAHAAGETGLEPEPAADVKPVDETGKAAADRELAIEPDELKTPSDAESKAAAEGDEPGAVPSAEEEGETKGE